MVLTLSGMEILCMNIETHIPLMNLHTGVSVGFAAIRKTMQITLQTIPVTVQLVIE